MDGVALLALLRRELPALVRQAVREELQREQLDPRHAELLDALVLVFGSSPFTAAEAVTAARGALSSRHRLQAALQSVGARDAQRLGMTLAALEKRAVGSSARLSRLGTEGGKRLWSVDQAEPGSS